MSKEDTKYNIVLYDAESREGTHSDSVDYMSRYRGYTLSSAFQPIISVPHRKVVGYEALVRATDSDGESCPPSKLFSIPDSSKEHLQLDRTLRSLHIHNFSKKKPEACWLFINLDSQSLSTEKPHEGFMKSLFSISGIKPQQVVIEILESEIKDKVYLKELIRHFRAMGCLIAIDDFGAGHSNFDRIWKLEPDIVKLDRNLITTATQSAKARRVIARMVSLIQEAGCLVVMEGLETKYESMVAIELGVDLLQGFYLGRPQKEINHGEEIKPLVEDIIEKQGDELMKSAQQLDRHFARFKNRYDDALKQFRIDGDFLSSVQIVLSEPRAIRCYLLDEGGYQIGGSVHSIQYEKLFDERLKPLFSGENACWAHKPYHYKAISKPNKIQVTRPYMSVAGLHMCITVSKAITLDQRVLVFCCDLEWKDE